MEFILCQISGKIIVRFLLDFWKICAPMFYIKKSTAHFQPSYFQLHLLAEVLLFYLVFLSKRVNSVFIISMNALCHCTSSVVQSVQ